jgi:hypothetical protein
LRGISWFHQEPLPKLRVIRLGRIPGSRSFWSHILRKRYPSMKNLQTIHFIFLPNHTYTRSV